MPDEQTHADSLRFYHTGASADGGSQSDPDASLGKNRAGDEVTQLGATVTDAISNVTVDYASGANGPGAGTLTASGNDELKWTPPGGTQGAGVTIANGETKILEGGNNEPEKFLRVTRTSADNLSGTATVTLAEEFNNVVGLDNVSSAEATSGDNEYRCLGLKNVSSSQIKSLKAWIKTLGTQMTTSTQDLPASGAGSIEGGAGDFADWPDTGYAHIKDSGGTTREVVYYESRTDDVLTVPANGRGLLGTSAAAGAATDTADAVPGIAICKEAPASQPTGAVEDETGTGEGTEPSSCTGSWNVAITSANGEDIGDLSAGNWYGLWIRRHVAAGALADASLLNHLSFSFDAA